MERLSRYLRDTATEMKHVKWPSTEQAVLYTVLVIVISTAVALLLSGFDFGFNFLLEQVV